MNESSPSDLVYPSLNAMAALAALAMVENRLEDINESQNGSTRCACGENNANTKNQGGGNLETAG